MPRIVHTYDVLSTVVPTPSLIPFISHGSRPPAAALAAPVVDATSSPGDSCGEMSPGAASHGHPFVISPSLSLPLCPSNSLSLSLSFSLALRPCLCLRPFSHHPLSLSLSLFTLSLSPPPPPSRGLALYPPNTPSISSDADDYSALVSRRIAKTHPFASRFPVTFVAYVQPHGNYFLDIHADSPSSPYDPGLRFSSRILVPNFSRARYSDTSLSLPLPAASQTRSFLASAESPPTGVTTIDYRRVWGWPGNCTRREGGWWW